MKAGQKGFTLIELVLATGIIAVLSLSTMIVTSIVTTSNDINCDQMTALIQAQNAGHWISRDVEMARSIGTDNLTLPQFLHLNWTDISSGDRYQVVYTLEDTANSNLKRLLRNESINGGPENKTFIAQYIDADPQKSSCEFSDGVLTLTITSTAGAGTRTQTVNRVYKILPRPD